MSIAASAANVAGHASNIAGNAVQSSLKQSTVIAGALFAAWLIYVTLRGELPSYMKVIGL